MVKMGVEQKSMSNLLVRRRSCILIVSCLIIRQLINKKEVGIFMLTLPQQLSYDLDKISLMRRIFTQRAAAKDGVFLGQLPVMRYISMNPGCTQKDVADFMHVSPPSVAVMVKRMVRDGIINKQTDEKDMRQNRLYITDTGLTMEQQCKEMFSQLDRQIYDG